MPHCDIGTIVAGLNPEQAAAVTAPVGAPLLVLAGAGCGKTTVLTRRIAYLAGEFCPANAVLALTFTRAAAREMAERVAAFPKENAGSGPPLITTFQQSNVPAGTDTISSCTSICPSPSPSPELSAKVAVTEMLAVTLVSVRVEEENPSLHCTK